MKTIAITGSNGFIGKAMVNYFLGKGWKVIGLCRNPHQQSVFHPNLSFLAYSLEEGLQSSHLEGIDSLLHLAFLPASTQAPKSDEINLNEVKNLVRIAQNSSVQIVYFSSMSAHKLAESQYGKHKFEAEKLLSDKPVLVLKPGLVIGKGGMLEKMKGLMRKLPIIPLVSGGSQPVQTLSMDNLCEATYTLMNQNELGVWTLAESNPTTVLNLYKTMAEIMQVRPFFLSVPYPLIFIPALIADKLGVSLPITLENLKGLKKLSSFDTTATEKTIKFTFGNMKANLARYSEFLQHD
jgi:nucleoside-diphosphate-sugar epimerase